MSEREYTSTAIDRMSNDSVRGEGGSNVTSIRLVGYDRPFFTALAIAISIISAFYSFEVGREKAQDVYWKQRIEVFLEQLSTQGIKVPPDLRHSKE